MEHEGLSIGSWVVARVTMKHEGLVLAAGL